MQFSITNIIIIITVIVSLTGFYNREFFDRFKFNAYMIHSRKEAWRFVTAAFLHVDFLHLIMNMYVLYMFGNSRHDNNGVVYGVEAQFMGIFGHGLKGQVTYLALYLLATITSTIYSYERHKHDIWYNAVGASGAVAAIIFAHIAMNPTSSISLFYIRFPAFIIGILYLVYSWYMGRRKIDNIGHDAHFFGALFGFAFIFITKPPLFMEFIRQVQIYAENFLR